MKGDHSNETMVDLAAVGIRSYVSEPDRGRRDWSRPRMPKRPCLALVAGFAADAAAT